MSISSLVKALAPVVALGLSAGLASCDNADVRINGEHGKKLSELDLSGPAPSQLVVMGPDRVELSQGDKLAITVDGDPAAVSAMRFTLKDGALGILREGKVFANDGKTAVVHVTMPAPSEITMAGSGKIAAGALASGAKVTVAGSGEVSTTALKGDSLELTMAGSGSYHAAGSVRTLNLTVAGTGTIDADALKIETAKVTIAGSGNASFASDGQVEASIIGSGVVKVKGRAHCTVSAMGSGRLECETPATVKKDD